MARVTLRLPDDLRRGLEHERRRRGVSLNQTIVTILNEHLSRSESTQPLGSGLEEQVRHIRSALLELVVEIDTGHLLACIDWSETERAGEQPTRSIPPLAPPLSATVSELREDRL